MAGKRKQAKAQREDLSRPSRWRLQHGGFSEPVREADPETGTPVQHRRAVDTLGLMLAKGSITQTMHDAGETFRVTFRIAALDGMRTTQLLRIQGGGGDLLTERQAAARRRLAEALDLFGGADSAGGSCLWHVLGLECSLREWAMRQGWSGRPVHHVQAQGILLTALGVLAAHYGLQPRERAA
ncbi:MAG: DUF6456 domain-containing protein [Paracraurococcus sp.]|jgi:hypothetical protein